MDKIQLETDRFLDWYFSDRDDLLTTANNMLKELYANACYNVTVQDFLDGCSELPDYIMVGNEDIDVCDTKYYSPSEIELI